MRVFKKSKTVQTFTIELRDHQRIVRRFVGLKDRRQTEQLGRRIETLVACRAARGQPDKETALWLEKAPPALKTRLAAVGIIDGSIISAAKPLTELLADFTAHLQAKERTAKYVAECDFMLRRIFTDCRFAVWTDISGGAVETYLKSLRDAGLSVRRSNGYLTVLKSLCRWMADTGQASESPVRGLRKLNEKVDVRRQRRAATPDELRRLISTTAEGPERFGMSGAERSLLYRFCCESGLRANETRTLTVGDFDLDGLTVRVRAGYSKHRETDTVPLRQELAEALRGHLTGKLFTGKVFGGRYKRLTLKTADMLKLDLADAGIPYVDEQGRVLDFHGTRHTFISGLRNAPSRVAQALARHKSSAMTDRYTHVQLHDERAALEMLPDLTVKPRDEQAKATGTDDAKVTTDAINRTNPVRESKSGARHGALWGASNSNSVKFGATSTCTGDGKNPVFQRARQDLNLQPSDSKSATTIT